MDHGPTNAPITQALLRRLVQLRRTLTTQKVSSTAADNSDPSSKKLEWAGIDADGQSLDVPEPQFSGPAGRTHDPRDDPIGPEALIRDRLRLEQQYRERGYIVCRNFFSKEQIAEYKAVISRHIADWQA